MLETYVETQRKGRVFKIVAGFVGALMLIGLVLWGLGQLPH